MEYSYQLDDIKGVLERILAEMERTNTLLGEMARRGRPL